QLAASAPRAWTPRSHARDQPAQLAASAPRYLGLSAPLGPSAPCAANTLPRPLGTPIRCTLPRPSAPCTPTSCAASAPRPHAQQAARCLGPSAPCAAPRCLGPSAPCAANTLHAASAPRPLAQLARLSNLSARDSLGHSLSETSSTRADLMRCLGPSAPCAACPPEHTCVVCPPASCYSIARCPRPHQRGLSAYVVLLGRSMPKATPARPARLRRATRSHDARDHTCVVCPPAPPLPKRGSPESCSSAPCRPRPHLRGQPACVVLLDSMPPETTPARPTRLRHAPRLQAARPAQLAASAPRYLGLSAPLGPSAPCAANTLPRPLGTPTSCAASAPRPHAQQAARCLGPSAPCAATRCLGPSAPCAANTLHAASAPRPLAQLARLSNLSARDSLGHSLSETSSTRADLMRCLGPSAPCAACPPEPRLRGLPARVVLLGSSALCHPRPRLRGLPACVMLLGFTPPETTPARPARLRRALR
ncbi:unnamed protein product, partial [Musa hybrid cultivar]